MSEPRAPCLILDDLRLATSEMNRLIAELEGQGVVMSITVYDPEKIQLLTNGPNGPTERDMTTSSTHIDWQADEIVPLGRLLHGV